MHVLIIHAHHEPKSFSSALKDRAVSTLTRLGHTVDVSDLYAMRFDPVSDRRNFTTVADPVFLKQQREEAHATDRAGFTPELVGEMENVLRADLLIFNFPLWWFGMPAVLKGWVDRVFAHDKMYGAGKLYENGIGRGKRALVTMTTGSAEGSFDGYGYNPPVAAILAPIQHGIFWFNGFTPLSPYVAYSVARLSDEERARMLDGYEAYLSTLERRSPIVLPPMSDFAEGNTDRLGRWMVETRSATVPDAARIAGLQREGKILAHWSTDEGNAQPISWYVVRAEGREAAEAIGRRCGHDDATSFAIHELARPSPVAVSSTPDATRVRR